MLFSIEGPLAQHVAGDEVMGLIGAGAFLVAAVLTGRRSHLAPHG